MLRCLFWCLTNTSAALARAVFAATQCRSIRDSIAGLAVNARMLARHDSPALLQHFVTVIYLVATERWSHRYFCDGKLRCPSEDTLSPFHLSLIGRLNALFLLSLEHVVDLPVLLLLPVETQRRGSDQDTRTRVEENAPWGFLPPISRWEGRSSSAQLAMAVPHIKKGPHKGADITKG